MTGYDPAAPPPPSRGGSGRGGQGGGGAGTKKGTASTPTRSTAPPSNPFTGGADNDQKDAPGSWQDEVGYDQYGWIDVVSSEVASSLSAWAKNNGYPASIAKQIYNQHAPQMFKEIQIWGFRGSDQMAYRTGTAQGLQEMVDWALNWFGGNAGIPLRRSGGGGGGGRRGGGGGGRRGPTADDIRNQYDMDELTNMVNEMNRAFLFEDNPNARKVATEYVDAMVASRGEKKLDFATFVEERIKKTDRFKNIYRNKPEHLSPIEYMAPYIQAARSMAAPDDADDIAIGGAQLGTSAQAFQQRLMREDTVTGSAPFIQGLESKLSEINQVFKGS